MLNYSAIYIYYFDGFAVENTFFISKIYSTKAEKAKIWRD